MVRPLNRPEFNRLHAIDWAKPGTKFIAVTEQNGSLEQCDYGTISLLQFVSKPEHNGIDIVIESPFESFEKEGRNEVLDAASKNSVRIFTINPRETANYRKEHRIEKSDPIDAKAIYLMAKEGKKHLKLASRLTSEKPNKSVYRDVVSLRYHGYKPKSVKPLLKYLPPAEEVPEELKEVLLAGRKYNVTFVVPNVVAAKAVAERGEGRDDFDRAVGSYSHGYPSILRSNFYYRMITTLEKRRMGLRSFNRPIREDETPVTDSERKTGKRKMNIADRPHHKDVMKLTRRATRWIFSQVKQKANN